MFANVHAIDVGNELLITVLLNIQNERTFFPLIN